MRHTTRFDTSHPLIYHLRTALKPIVCFLCHITSYTTPLASFNFDQLHQRITSRYSFTINIVNMRHTSQKPLSFSYYRPPSLKPIVCFLCHITRRPPQPLSISIKLHLRIAFRYSFQHKHSQYEAHDPLRYTPAPYIPPLYSFKANSMLFMSHNFLYDPLSLFQFR